MSFKGPVTFYYNDQKVDVGAATSPQQPRTLPPTMTLSSHVRSSSGAQNQPTPQREPSHGRSISGGVHEPSAGRSVSGREPSAGGAMEDPALTRIRRESESQPQARPRSDSGPLSPSFAQTVVGSPLSPPRAVGYSGYPQTPPMAQAFPAHTSPVQQAHPGSPHTPPMPSIAQAMSGSPYDPNFAQTVAGGPFSPRGHPGSPSGHTMARPAPGQMQSPVGSAMQARSRSGSAAPQSPGQARQARLAWLQAQLSNALATMNLNQRMTITWLQGLIVTGNAQEIQNARTYAASNGIPQATIEIAEELVHLQRS